MITNCHYIIIIFTTVTIITKITIVIILISTMDFFPNYEWSILWIEQFLLCSMSYSFFWLWLWVSLSLLLSMILLWLAFFLFFYHQYRTLVIKNILSIAFNTRGLWMDNHETKLLLVSTSKNHIGNLSGVKLRKETQTIWPLFRLPLSHEGSPVTIG